jgi:hypothetical protein
MRKPRPGAWGRGAPRSQRHGSARRRTARLCRTLAHRRPCGRAPRAPPLATSRAGARRPSDAPWPTRAHAGRVPRAPRLTVRRAGARHTCAANRPTAPVRGGRPALPSLRFGAQERGTLVPPHGAPTPVRGRSPAPPPWQRRAQERGTLVPPHSAPAPVRGRCPAPSPPRFARRTPCAPGGKRNGPPEFPRAARPRQVEAAGSQSSSTAFAMLRNIVAEFDCSDPTL